MSEEKKKGSVKKVAVKKKKPPVKKKSPVKKKVAVKSSSVKKRATSAKGKPTKTTISAAERRQMIAEAAYYIAEQRNFLGGDVHNDWLEAEKQIDARYKAVD